MEWSNELVLEFIQLYEQEPVIWDPQHRLHKNRNAIHEAWIRIRGNLSVLHPVADLKKKKEVLMATYRKISTKVQHSIRNGAGEDDVYRPEWFAYDAIHRFLNGIYKPKQVLTEEGSVQYVKAEYSNAFIEEGMTWDETSYDPLEETNAAANENGKRKRLAINEEAESMLIERGLNIALKEKDDDERFGDYVALELKSLRSELNKKRLKSKIRRAVAEIADEELNKEIVE